MRGNRILKKKDITILHRLSSSSISRPPPHEKEKESLSDICGIVCPFAVGGGIQSYGFSNAYQLEIDPVFMFSPD
jgi:hypothetical protein